MAHKKPLLCLLVCAIAPFWPFWRIPVVALENSPDSRSPATSKMTCTRSWKFAARVAKKAHCPAAQRSRSSGSNVAGGCRMRAKPKRTGRHRAVINGPRPHERDSRWSARAAGDSEVSRTIRQGTGTRPQRDCACCALFPSTTARERGTSDIIDLQEFAGHADPRTTLAYIRSRDRGS